MVHPGPAEAAEVAPVAPAVPVVARLRIILTSLGVEVAEAVATNLPVGAATGRLVEAAMSPQAAVATDAKKRDGIAGLEGATPTEGVAARATAVPVAPMSPVGWLDTTSDTSWESLR